MQNELSTTLEALIDKHTLSTVLETLGDIAFEKATHLDHNWQDKQGCKSWSLMGRKLESLNILAHNHAL